ncbi:MAG: hypothetical protein WCJ56_12635 [bacterium]
MSNYNAQRRKMAAHVADLQRLESIWKLMTKVYSATGEEKFTIGEIQDTEYYPYNEHYTYLWDKSGELEVHIARETGRITATGYLRISSGKTFTNILSPVNILSKEEITRLRMHQLTLGVGERIAFVNNIRKEFIDSNELNLNNYYGHNGKGKLISYTEKVIPVPEIDDIPADNNALEIFTEWNKRIENVKALEDGWGNPLRFRIVDGIVKCSSPGEDGVFGNSDDMKN